MSDVGTALRLIGKWPPERTVDAAMGTAQAHLRERLVTLFSDGNNFVRRSLMEVPVLARLATFFGPSRSNDTILSHMVTFLNDKVGNS